MLLEKVPTMKWGKASRNSLASAKIYPKYAHRSKWVSDRWSKTQLFQEYLK